MLLFFALEIIRTHLESATSIDSEEGNQKGIKMIEERMGNSILKLKIITPMTVLSVTRFTIHHSIIKANIMTCKMPKSKQHFQPL